ncbi:MAG: c-type cytochrome, partial [Pseudomonadales bacterium]|nr:c-type cytochrome [Pseudomonadales bacterium]
QMCIRDRGEGGVADVTQYVLSLSGRDHVQDAAIRGKASFNVMCIACHGAQGKGNVLFGAPDLSNDIWLYGGAAESIALSIRDGRSGIMPSQSDVLDDNRITILSGFLLNLSK